MAVKGKTKDRDRAGAASVPGALYDPTRPARLAAATDPPPVPEPADIDPDGFGTADEDGLRMLAALQSLTSLEPDYAVDLAAEASVTIIEAAHIDAAPDDFDRPAHPQRPLSANAPPIRPYPSGFDPFDGTAAPLDEEATVEIIETPLAIEDAAAPPSRLVAQPASLSERIASVAGRTAGGRFFKALSGG